MKLPGAKTARRIASRWRAEVSGAGLILGYHRVADESHDPWGLAVGPDHFRSHMERLREAFEPVPLDSILESAAGGGGRGAPLPVAVTFDDGYRDVLENALPVLEELEIPATLFIVTGALGGVYWWDRLAAVLGSFLESGREVRFQAGTRMISWNPGQDEERLMEDAHRVLQAADPGERERVLSALEAAPAGADGVQAARAPSERTSGTTPRTEGSTGVRRPPPSVLSGEEIRALSRHPLVEIGSHTVTHRRLSDLVPAEVAHEVAASRRHLESLVDGLVTSFSFPHGAVHSRVPHHVAAAGYHRGCVSRNGLVTEGTDRYRLPRLWPADLAGPEFSRWLRSWTGR